MQSFATLGLLNQLGTIELLDWSTFVNQSLMLQYNVTEATPPPLSSLIPSEDIQYLNESLAWLGLAESSSHLATTHNQMPPLPPGRLTPLSIFAYLLSRKLKYQPHETDMVVLSHEIITRQDNDMSEDGYSREVHTSTLYTFGHQKPDVPFKGARPASAMARTVGSPLAIASLLVLEGKIDLRGVRRPTWPQIYRPIMNHLQEVGLEMREDTRKLTKSERTVAGTLAMTDDTTRIKDAKSRVLVPQGLSLDPETDPKLKLAGTWSRDLKQDFRDFGVK
jgi:alpha-aminoadipic semialdehyde synthase